MQENENLNVSLRDYATELLTIIRSDLTNEEVKEQLENYHESDIAEIIPELNKEERLRLYKLLGDEFLSEIFSYLDDVEDFVEELSNEKVADIIEEMDTDDAVEVLEELDDEKRQEIIELLDEETVSEIKLIDSYPDDVIGSRMSTNFITIDHAFSVKQAMRSVVDQAAENDNISTIYATNLDGTYYGAISLRDLVVARSTVVLDDIISTAYPFLYADAKIDDCIETLRDYYEDSIPLLSSDNRVIGVITSSELADIVGEEIEEDYARLAGLTEQEDLEEPLFYSVKKRMPWLIALMFLGLLVSSLIGSFSTVITLLPILVCFQSLILGMCGNVGTQSLAVTIRVITSGTLEKKERNRLIFKELRIGLVNGLLIGVMSALICSLYIYFVVGDVYGISNYLQSLEISACIGGALLASMTVASLAGTLIPLLFKKIKIDPAVASGPLLTTINDMIAATVYYGLAWIFLIKILGI
ncbi:MAG: magnesium transporter [Clostridia bacterium]|nr:magnesium transporter [Clostridia bacterium]